MTSTSESWIAASATALKRRGSWVGRTHLHKHLYFVHELGLAEPPFGFVMYQYGPYSFDLDREIAEMELYGYLRKSFPQQGYGPRYEVSDIGLKQAASLDANIRKALDAVADAIGDFDSQKLELQATCLWVERQEEVAADQDIVARVKQLKPRYSEGQIREELASVRQLAAGFKERK